MRQKLVAGNWKMNGSMQANQQLLENLKQGVTHIQAEIAVCPPFPYLLQVKELLKNTAIRYGAQNVSHESDGAFTGEVSAAMLVDLACTYVLVGHSERRTLYAETDEGVAEKFVVAQRAGLIPILCVGESLTERESGDTEKVVERQLNAVLTVAGVGAFSKSVIAYEPVWAIGTGKTASAEQAQAVHTFIRQHLAKQPQGTAVAQTVQILYGGSVKANNATELFAMPDIDGGLIGGASLKADDFLAICQAAHSV
ncbi:triose-phosphate isomerase [Beggiatoa leptomitoformis]|uniref:Triosephosphate isomerase n=1 Tax=Beggiatoa leptomitoformis TaxID=288004 RepID=A0A2N9YBL3_9GAMM|nr:triose-phosphate isomerase [Beggiatoa leptomitoformis]ALG66840.1 triose-phosphate isomerase [Beggiatoa leptomitoformis]AUI67809.1 triose-phosphate isomerase [Beggiatoa leptomitoformis]